MNSREITSVAAKGVLFAVMVSFHHELLAFASHCLVGLTFLLFFANSLHASVVKS